MSRKTRPLRTLMMVRRSGNAPQLPEPLLRPSNEEVLWGFLCGAHAIKASYCDASIVHVIPAVGSASTTPTTPLEHTERVLAKKRLSAEARHVIGIILNGPSEVVDALMNDPTKDRVGDLLESEGWNRATISKAFAEVEAYVNAVLE